MRTQRIAFVLWSALFLAGVFGAAATTPVMAQSTVAISSFGGAWAPGIHSVGTVVTYDGLDYICINATKPGSEQPDRDTTDWQVFSAGVQTRVGNTSAGLSALPLGFARGIDDTAYGFNALAGPALPGSSSGIENTAVGSNALASANDADRNVAVGYDSQEANTRATDNVAVGSSSLAVNVAGSKNTAIGSQALDSLNAAPTAGLVNENNTAIGFSAGHNLATGVNNIYVANLGPPLTSTGAASSESNTIRIGTVGPVGTVGIQTKTFVAGIANYNILSSDDPNLPVFIDTVTGQLGYGSLEAGPQGPAGPAGTAGPAGATGAKGATGATGATGSQGPQGLQGQAGAQGPAGQAGTNGTNGTNGIGFNFRGAWVAGNYSPYDVVTDSNGNAYVAIGASGNPFSSATDPSSDTTDWTIMAAAGAPGATGAAGLQGPQGFAGATGQTGVQGPEGNTGPAGPTGPAGATGPAGTAGAAGATGQQGPAGTAATIAVGSVTTGAAGSIASVSNVGVPSAAIFNFVIPQGATGAQGPSGSGSSTFNYRGTFSSKTGYNPNDVVSYEGTLYIASSAVFGVTPPSPSSWTEVVDGVFTDSNLDTAGGLGTLTNNTGSANSAFGNGAMSANTTGSNNTAYGENALANNTTGYSNSANGQNALYSNTTGFFNNASGSAALYYNSTGANNIADGEGAMYVNSSGNNNTAVGQNALRNSTTGSGNIALGYLAGTGLQNGSNNIYVGNQGVDGVSGTIWIGAVGTHTNAYFAGISNTNLTSDAAALPVFVDPNTGQLGTGALTAGPTGPVGPTGPAGPAGAPGSPGQTGATGATGATGPTGATGAQGSAGPQGVPGTNGTGVLTDSSLNTSAGVGSLAIPVPGGNQNTAYGYDALSSSTGGAANSAFGARALASNSANGGANVAIGTSAMYLFNSGYNNNTAVGTSAMGGALSGGDNTAIGAESLSGANMTGGYNIALGFDSGAAISSGSGNIEIGNEGTDSDFNVTRIGGGTLNPTEHTFIAGINGSTTGLPGTAVVIDANGQLGTVSSSRRYKEDIEPMADATDRLLQLRPVQFRYKKPNANGEKPIQYGLIAEEVQEVLPELVVLDKDGQPETVAYHLLPAMLLNELQKEHAKNEEHTKQLSAQEKVIQEQAANLAVAQAKIKEADRRISADQSMIGEENDKIVAMHAEVSEVAALKTRLADLERATALLAKMNRGDGVTVQTVSQRSADLKLAP